MAQIGTIEVNGVELAWSEQGNEPGRRAHPGPVPRVHRLVARLLATGRRAWRPHRRVVTLDQRGHGSSTKTGTLEGYTIEQLADDLAAFLDAVSDGPVDLLGHSMGGRVVMTMVLARPELVRSLILMDTSAWSFQPVDEALRTMARDYIDGVRPRPRHAGRAQPWAAPRTS